jgi:hypothetical protein
VLQSAKTDQARARKLHYKNRVLRSAEKSGKVPQMTLSDALKRQAIISLVLIAALAVASAENTPSKSPSPSPNTSETEEPALPTSEAVPSNDEPGLLPESGELPARPPAGAPSNLSSTPESPTPEFSNERRFDEIRSLAMSNPRAAYLLKRARDSSHPASRRAYLRAYYVTVASRMRKLDPKLKSSIDAYEEAKIHEVSGARTSTARVSSRRSRLHRIASQQAHHRMHRVSLGNRYRRRMIIYDPYGPYFAPYGPPVVFYPW